MNPGSATQRPVPRTLERTQPLESPSAISDSEFWADRQRAFLEFLDRANELAYAISQEELLHQALGLILEAAQAESAI